MAADFGAGVWRQAEKPWKRESADQRDRCKGEAEVKHGQSILAGATQEKGGLQRDAAKGNTQTKSHLLRDVHQCRCRAALCRRKVNEGKREETRQSKRAKAAGENQEHHDR